MKTLAIVVLLIILALSVGEAYYISKKKPKPTPSPPHTGPPQPSCMNAGEICSQISDCCMGLSCVDGECIDTNVHPTLQSFLLSTKGNCIIVDELGHLMVTGTCSWNHPVDNYWFWDGINQLSYRVITRDPNGNPAKVSAQSIASPASPGYPSMLDAGDVRLTKEGAIYSPDFTMCLSVEEDTERLVWSQCLDIPDTFDITPPVGCSQDGQCSVDSQCCPPFNSCINGACAMCLGDPTCENSTDYAVCDSKTQTFKCVSHCTGTAVCEPNEYSKCSSNYDGSYSPICVSQCTGDQIQCTTGHQSTCTGSGNTWGWQCPFDPCSQPSPNISTAPVPFGYTLKGDHFEGPVAGEAWLYPVWQCQTQEWINYPGCNTGYYQNCAGPDMKATCGASTSFNWSCESQQDGTDLCGLNATKPSCQDVTCMDLNDCGGVASSGNNWNWVCPSDTNTTLCQLESIYGWEPVQYKGYSGDIIVDTDGIPLYPTIMNDKCRSTIGSYTQYPDQIAKANNPGGTVMDVSGTHIFIPYPEKFDGTNPYVYTDSGHKWNCPTPNPCYPNGAFVNMTGGTWSPIFIPPPAGEWGSPTPTELSTVGKCACYSGYAGDTCQYSGSKTCNGGAITSCQTNTGRCINEEYMCSCPSGKYGLHCQFTGGSCGNGTPAMDSDNLECTCNGGFYGSPCAGLCSQIGTPYPVPVLYKSGTYDLAFGSAYKYIRPGSEVVYQQYNFPNNVWINGASISQDFVPKFGWTFDAIKQTIMYGSKTMVFRNNVSGPGASCSVLLVDTVEPTDSDRFIIGSLPKGTPGAGGNVQGIYNIDTGLYIGLMYGLNGLGVVSSAIIANGGAMYTVTPR